jgi:putative ABC transport system permease protein
MQTQPARAAAAGVVRAIVSDLRVAARSLGKTPAFTAAAIIALALGIGATTAILSVVNAVLLRPLPYADAGRLVVLLHGGTDPVAPANFLDWRTRTRSFSAMAAADYWTPDETGGENPEQINGLRVTTGMFPLLGVQPLLGRTFLANEDQAGNEHVVVVSYGLWQRRFGGDRSVVGKPLSLNGQICTVVGVMPRTFQFAPFWATKAELWAPLPLRPSRDAESLRIFARLRDGVTLTQARADVAAVTAQLERDFPGPNRDVVVTPLQEKVVGSIETPLLVLFAAVGFVLLIACANVAHMLLARATARGRELAVRTALGATRKRLTAQLLAESVLLAAIGGACGVVLAAWGVRALVAAGPAIIPRVASVTVDARVLSLTVVVTAFTALIFGLLPALRGSRVDIAGALRAADRSGSAGDRGRLRALLVASEFSLALVLLVAAGLMIRTFVALRHVDPGFDPRGVISMTVSTTGTPAADSTQHAAFYFDALTRVRAIPGVVDASYINHLPLGGDNWGVRFRVEGRAVPRPGEAPRATYRVVFPNYFSTMRIPLLAGRPILASDRLDAPRVVVVNDYMARTHWPNESAIGKRIAFGDTSWITVVGVTRNAVRESWSAPPEEELYLPFFQQPGYMKGLGPRRYMTLVARTSCDGAACDAATFAPRIRDAIRAAQPRAPISSVVTMNALVDIATAESRFYVALLGAFAGIALLLAAVGIYGVMSYAVARRTNEIGIRIALGAEPGMVLRSVVKEGLALAGIGAVIGLALSLAFARLMRGILFGVSPTDLLTFAGVTATLTIAALVASVVPALRATRIDPLQALRH